MTIINHVAELLANPSQHRGENGLNNAACDLFDKDRAAYDAEA